MMLTTTATPPSAAPLTVDCLSLSFGGNRVLQDIALAVQPGEITGLIEAQRGYELNAKVITAADQMLSATAQVR